MKKIIIVVVAVGVLLGAGFWYWQTAHASAQMNFQVEEVKYGRLTATVSSTGTLEPQELVDIGAQVTGRIVYIGPDPNTHSKFVDWGSAVVGPSLGGNTDSKALPSLGASAAGLMGSSLRAPLLAAPALVYGAFNTSPGTLLLKIDDDLYKAKVAADQAAIKAAQSDLLQKQAQLVQYTSEWKRAQELFQATKPRGIAQAEYDASQATYNSAVANVESSKANIALQQANLKMDQTNLNYTTINSPVNGMVIDRRVNVGQTVVSNLSASSLFLIAKDLTRLEVWATVNEVDIGKVKTDQDVKFTVDAFPGRKFKGKVVAQGKSAFRYNATMTQNVVTYTVVVSVDNKDLTLAPYMTTNLSFIVEDKKDALLVPNAALRWQPSKQLIAPEVRDAYNKFKSKKKTPTDNDAQDHGFVWVKGADGFVRYSEVRTGPSDTVNSEVLGVISGLDLPEHTQVIIGDPKAESQAGGGASPFLPQLFKPKPKD